MFIHSGKLFRSMWSLLHGVDLLELPLYLFLEPGPAASVKAPYPRAESTSASSSQTQFLPSALWWVFSWKSGQNLQTLSVMSQVLAIWG